MNRKNAILTVFIVGICITAIEVASARIIAPFFGSTVYVWGGAIGTVLTALAVGYWAGGKLIDRRPALSTISMTIRVAGFFVLIIPWIYGGVLWSLTNWTNHAHLPVGLMVVGAILALFFIPVMGMGMVSPMVLRMSLKNVDQAGSWSGLLSGVATLGSIIGTFISAYWTIPTFGSRFTVLGAAVLLLAISIQSIKRSPKILSVMIVALLLTGGIIASTPFVSRAGLVWAKESAYQLVQVIKQNDQRFLIHDAAQATQSLYQPSPAYLPTLYDVFGLLPYVSTNHDHHRSLLLIGLGGGNMVRLYEQAMEKDFDIDITAVEVDPAVVTAARKYFDLDTLKLRVIVDDARHYLRGSETKYDIIIVDAYTHETQIPPMLATKEFFTQVRDHLQPGGVLGINAFVQPGSRYFPKLASTVAASFPDVRTAPFIPGSLNQFVIAADDLNLTPKSETMNPIIRPYLSGTIAHLRRVQPSPDIYTDDRTNLEILVRPFLR